MGRKSLKKQRRAEITQAFARVLSQHGYAGATILAVAEEADLTPGLLHHHFKSKREMLLELLDMLISDFRSRVSEIEIKEDQSLDAYIDAALKLDERADTVFARCWVGIFSEALKDSALMDKIKRYLDAEIERINEFSGQKLSVEERSGVLAYIIGSLVFGAFAPIKTRGFAAKVGHKFVASLNDK